MPVDVLNSMFYSILFVDGGTIGMNDCIQFQNIHFNQIITVEIQRHGYSRQKMGQFRPKFFIVIKTESFLAEIFGRSSLPVPIISSRAQLTM